MKNKQKHIERWQGKIEEIYDSIVGSDEISDWEIEFLDSIEIQLNQDRELTLKQSKCLNKIYDKIV